VLTGLLVLTMVVVSSMALRAEAPMIVRAIPQSEAVKARFDLTSTGMLQVSQRWG
jgi:hypothetical protein